MKKKHLFFFGQTLVHPGVYHPTTLENGQKQLEHALDRSSSCGHMIVFQEGQHFVCDRDTCEGGKKF